MSSSVSLANSQRSGSSNFYSAGCRSLSPCTSSETIESTYLSASIDPPLFSSTSFSAQYATNTPIYNNSLPSCSGRRLDETDSEFEGLGSCEVFVGFCGREPFLKRFVKWLYAEMVMYGFTSFVSNRKRCVDARTQAMARKAMEEAVLGLVVVTRKSFASPWSIEELNFLFGRKILIPIFFGLNQAECIPMDIIEKKGKNWDKYGGRIWNNYGGSEGEWREAVEGLLRCDLKIEVKANNMRSCILDAISLIGKKMGRKDVLEKLRNWKAVAAKEELPFLRNPNFIGRKNELVELGLMLFGDNGLEWENDFINLIPEKRYKRAGEPEQKKSKDKGKESRVRKESKEEIELEYTHDAVRVGRSQTRKKGSRSESKAATDVMLGKGIACVSGESGIGKSELLLEFAYRHAQMYKMVLWIGGETRYIRSNYTNLMPLLGIDASINNDLSMERNTPKNFDETEGEAIRKVRKELMRGIPYLLVIDNLERERDWWDGRNIMELLPRFGGETHIIISSRHPNVVKIPSLRLSYLAGAEARSLMEGSLQLMTTREDDVFGVIEERLRKLPLGLAIIGAILSECCANPPKLLEAINSMPHQEVQGNCKEGIVSRKNSFLVRLLDFLFQLFSQWKKHGNLAKRMVQASCCFAPSPIPTSMLVLAADEVSKLSSSNCCLKDCFQMFTRGLVNSHGNLLSVEAASQMLVRFQIARFTRDGSILVHDIVRDYANQREGYKFASAMIRALSIKGCLPEHLNHIWAACFLVFKFNLSSPVVSLAVPDLLSFIRQLVIPLTHHSYTVLSNCNAVLDLLRHSTEALEFVENLIIGDANIEESMSFCFTRSSRFAPFHASPLSYQDLVLLRAKLLEIRTKFMILCGQYEIGEQLCRTALNIKEAIYGLEHPETRYTCDVMQKFISSQVH